MINLNSQLKHTCKDENLQHKIYASLELHVRDLLLLSEELIAPFDTYINFFF